MKKNLTPEEEAKYRKRSNDVRTNFVKIFNKMSFLEDDEKLVKMYESAEKEFESLCKWERENLGFSYGMCLVKD